MEIDDDEFLNVRSTYFDDEQKQEGSDKFIKKTHLHSPVFTNIIPNFKVLINKKFKGLKSKSVNDEEDQYFMKQDDDSQLDVFDDSEEDDLFRMIGDDDGHLSRGGSKVEVEMEVKEFKSIILILKLTSILVNGVEFAMTSPIRSSCVVPGRIEEGFKEEDSLLISLMSGFLFLIRIYYVPLSTKDSSFESDFSGRVSYPSKGYMFKPYIVQWWDTSKKLILPSLESTGYKVFAHWSGRAVVSMSASSVIRVYSCQPSEMGTVFLAHFNIPIDGFILHGCFAYPSNNVVGTHYMFLVMSFTENRRIELNLFSWSVLSKEKNDLSKTTLPLDNEFPIPIFIIPLRNHEGFLLVTKNELILLGIHDILCANYEFVRHPFEGAFPTSYYQSNTSIVLNAQPETEEIILSTQEGMLYSILIEGSKNIECIPIVKLLEPIGVFSIEYANDLYHIIYGSATGANRYIRLNDLLDVSSILNTPRENVKYSEVSVIENYKNWAPIIDVAIIDSPKSRRISLRSEQELWVLTGANKKTKLTQLRSGFGAIKMGSVYNRLKKIEKLFKVEYDNMEYLICNSAFETVLLELPVDEESFKEGGLSEIEDSSIIETEDTILVSKIGFSDLSFVQVTNNQILLSNFVSVEWETVFEDSIILAASVCENFLVVAFDRYMRKEITLETFILSENENEKKILKQMHCIPLERDISTVKSFLVNGSIHVLVGDYSSTIILYKITKDTITEINFINLRTLNRSNSSLLLEETYLVPQECEFDERLKSCFIGTKDGFYIQLKYDDSLNFHCEQFLRVGTTQVQIQISRNLGIPIIYILSRRLWVVNFLVSCFPVPVDFEEKYDRIIFSISSIRGADDGSKELIAVAREDGLAVCQLPLLERTQTIRLVSVSEAKKVLFLPHMLTFIILGDSAKQSNRIRFIDRQLLKIISHREVKTRLRTEETTACYVFLKDEVPICACIWSIQRSQRVSKKILIGCSSGDNGSFKVLDVGKIRESEGNEYLQVSELTAFKHKAPIVSIQQIGNTIVFSSGKQIYYTAYDSDERKLKSIASLISLTSDIVALTCFQNYILVTSRLDSVLQFKFSPAEASEGKLNLELISKDPIPRSIVNHVSIGPYIIASDKLQSSVLFMHSKNKLLRTIQAYKMPCTLRLFTARFRSLWDNLTRDLHVVLCIGVSGEVTTLRLDSSHLLEIESVDIRSNEVQVSLFDSLIEVLNRPFSDKVTGKGLKSLYKPYFWFNNNEALIDYDLEEISLICQCRVTI